MLHFDDYDLGMEVIQIQTNRVSKLTMADFLLDGDNMAAVLNHVFDDLQVSSVVRIGPDETFKFYILECRGEVVAIHIKPSCVFAPLHLRVKTDAIKTQRRKAAKLQSITPGPPGASRYCPPKVQENGARLPYRNAAFRRTPDSESGVLRRRAVDRIGTAHQEAKDIYFALLPRAALLASS